MYISAFAKQCFVTLGVSINSAVLAMGPGFTARLFPQLRQADSTIPVDDDSISWIASIHAYTLFIGNLSLPIIMGHYGRKPANLISAATFLFSWICIIFANSVTWILIAKLLQGYSMGMVISLSPIIIAEYTSPGSRTTLMSVSLLQCGISSLFVHTLGSYLSWRITAVICATIAFVGFLILLVAPESPCWLIEKGKYEEGRKSFFWLREEDEADELEKLIATSKCRREITRANETKSRSFYKSAKSNISKYRYIVGLKEFYMPIFISIHLLTFGHWCGSNIVIIYMQDVFSIMAGSDININVQILILDIIGFFYNTSAIFIMRRFTRRFVLNVILSFNICVLLVSALYSYCKTYDVLPYDHPVIGIVLIHLIMFSFVTGIFPLSSTIDGEIFAMEYRSFSAGITTLYFSIMLSSVLKSFPYLLNSIGLHGVYLLCAGLCVYSFIILLIFLPETKNKTLQEIEDMFKSDKVTTNELKSVKPLKHFDGNITD